ncbi:S-type anion channel SLAH4-like isoform X1 [Punica granatum]|uniref:S-type anion channel SLAH4-like isoform X1 n=2 Tax=Punica granatum TaxID=22663 RepID=A0A6P8BNW8_PUNGR|nr:S-type anion channel SLAH4-like isoform X1 [Punica granatum]
MESLQIPHQPPMAMRQVPVDASQPASRVQPHHHRNRANHQQTASPIRQFKPSILTRLHAGYFRISLSLASQALLLKMLTQPAAGNSSSNPPPLGHFLRSDGPFRSISLLFFWLLALVAQVLLSALYALRCCFHFQLVRAEFFHHVGVNYLFAPWISWLVLLLSSPTAISEIKAPYLALWWAFAIPVVLLDVKIYGQWFTTEKRFLSMVANPTSLISVIGNLVGSRAASRVGWKESAVCLFSLGMAHYLVLFVTLYQRLSGGDRLPAMLRPVFFLFFAAPSMASLAWNSISGTFDTGSKMLFFLSLFLFASLACRPALFKKSMRKFNVAWWAYSFPLTFLALASAEYAQEVKGTMASVLMLVLSALSFLVFLGLMLLTVLNTHRILREDDPILRFDKDRSRN